MLLSKNRLLVICGLLTLLALNSAPSFASVGKVLYALGNVSVETPATVSIKRGDRIEAGHVIVTGPKAYLQILLDDGTKIDLRPNSRFVVESLEMPAEPPSAENPAGRPAIGAGNILQANFALQKGGFRTKTGLVSKRDPLAYRVATPSAVIGVRGTNYTARFCDGDCGGGADDGLFIGISEGAGSITNDGGVLELGTNEYGFAADFATAPKQLVAPPESLNDAGLDGLESEEEEEEEEETASSDDDEASGDDEDAESEEVAAEGAGDTEEEVAAEETGDAEDVAAEEGGTTDDVAAEGGGTTDDDAVATNTDGESTADSNGTASGGTDEGGQTGTSGTAESGNSLNSEFGATSTVATAARSAPSTPPPSARAAPVTAPAQTSIVEPPQVVVVTTTTGGAVDITAGRPITTPRGLAFALSPSAAGLNSVNETMVFDTAGNLTGFTDPRAVVRQVYQLGTARNLNAGVDSANQLKWGRWAQGTATIRPAGATATTAVDLTNRSLHWLVGPVNAPVQVITGTANYVLAGNTDPTNNAGQVGILGSATFAADFTNGTVASNVQLGIANDVWKATGTGAINANLFNGLYNTVTVNDVVGGSGAFGGVFTNVVNGTPQGAGLTYQLVDGARNVSGVAVFRQQ